MSKHALIIYGGWSGHRPLEVAAVFARLLEKEGFIFHLRQSFDWSRGTPGLAERLNVIVPVWTMGSISSDELTTLTQLVESGVGLAGCHGGMCDAFRNSPDYQLMTGGQWVAHPGNDGVEYTVHIADRDHFITRGIEDYVVRSEQYYMHVDPSNHVLATTRFPIAPGPHTPNGQFDMPVAWTRFHGKGRVFYHAVGHTPEVLEQPETLEMCRRGVLWAAKSDT
jgi:type 1 glutamine amidotransferase